MTREESTIQALRNHIEALEETIKALEQETCEDVVTREAVIDEIEFYQINPQHFDFVSLINDIKDLPPVTPTQQEKGHLILLDECANSGYYCSKCHKKVVKEGWSDTVKKIKYCPNCGVKIER